MIRALRRQHRILAPGMLLAALAAVVIAVVARPARPRQPIWPIEPSAGRSSSVDELGVELRIAPGSGGGHPTWARATRSLGIPDPLLYLVPAAPPDSSSLPEDAVFVGSVADRFRGSVEVTFPAGSGFLVVWSNGYRRIAGVAPFDFRMASQP